VKKLIAALALAGTFGCVPLDACPGETQCNDGDVYTTIYCCPAADVCVGLNGSYTCYGYGSVANGQPKADAVSDGPATAGKSQ
jgi:hypothetical protein